MNDLNSAATTLDLEAALEEAEALGLGVTQKVGNLDHGFTKCPQSLQKDGFCCNFLITCTRRYLPCKSKKG